MFRTPSLVGPFPFPVARDSVRQNADPTAIPGVNIDVVGLLVPSVVGTESRADAEDAVGTLVPSSISSVVVAIAIDDRGTLVPTIASGVAAAVQDYAAGILAPTLSATDVVALSEESSGRLFPTVTASGVLGVSEVEFPGDTGGVIGAIASGSLVPQISAATVRPTAIDGSGILLPSLTADEATLPVVVEDMLGVLSPTMAADASITTPAPITAELSYGSDGLVELRAKQQKSTVAPIAPLHRTVIVAGSLRLTGSGSAIGHADSHTAGRFEIAGGARASTDLSETELLHMYLAAA